MSIETEIKIKIEDLEDFCRRLEMLTPEVLSPRHFEDNHLLDFPERNLGSSGCMLRVRFAKGASHLTFKGPSRPEGVFKTREELETGLEDGAATLQILIRLGMKVGFRYQKYRREYAIDGVHVAVDETPIGNYAEFEGSEEGIRGLAVRMDVAESSFIRFSYYALYLEHCREAGISPGSMVY